MGDSLEERLARLADALFGSERDLAELTTPIQTIPSEMYTLKHKSPLEVLSRGLASASRGIHFAAYGLAQELAMRGPADQASDYIGMYDRITRFEKRELARLRELCEDRAKKERREENRHACEVFADTACYLRRRMRGIPPDNASQSYLERLAYKIRRRVHERSV